MSTGACERGVCDGEHRRRVGWPAPGCAPTGRRRPDERGGGRIWAQSQLERFASLRATYVDQSFPAHAHETTWVIATNLQGDASCFGDPKQLLTPGALGVVPPGMPHAGHRTSEEPWVYLAVYPTRGLICDLFRQLTGLPRACPEIDRMIYHDEALVEQFVAAHRETLHGHAPGAGKAMIDFFVELLARHASNGAPTRGEEAGDVIDRTIDYIRRHLDRPLSLDELAAASGLSRYYFLRLFKQETGRTPHAFVMQQRVELARRLLERGAPIAFAALDAGFADQAHLTRRFKQLVGVTPGELVRGVRAPAVAGPSPAAGSSVHRSRPRDSVLAGRSR